MVKIPLLFLLLLHHSSYQSRLAWALEHRPQSCIRRPSFGETFRPVRGRPRLSMHPAARPLRRQKRRSDKQQQQLVELGSEAAVCEAQFPQHVLGHTHSRPNFFHNIHSATVSKLTYADPPKPQGIFGVPLRQSIVYANVAISLVDDNGKSYIYGYVPIVVAKCGVFLKEKGR